MIGKVQIYRSGGHNPSTCKLCNPLPCEPDWHDAAQRVHATLVPRYWADELAAAKARAKKLWRVRREETDYRVPIVSRQATGARAGARRGGRASRA